MSELVSIIVPYFNSENTLANALGSVQDQEYEAIEIICVNDGSTDRSWEIANRFNFDKRIVHLRQENLGLGAARNAGMKVATGKYVTFVDSDDVIPPNYVQELMNCMSPECDIAIAGYKIINNTGEITASITPNSIRGDNVLAAFLTGYSNMACSKIYRMALLKENNLGFPEGGIIHEDLGFTIKAIYFSSSISTTDKTYYIWNKTENSLSRAFTPQHFASIVYIFRDNIEFLKSKQLFVESAQRKMQLHFFLMSKMIEHSADDILIESIKSKVSEDPGLAVTTAELHLLMDNNKTACITKYARINCDKKLLKIKEKVLPAKIGRLFLDENKIVSNEKMSFAFLFVKVFDKIFRTNHMFSSEVSFAFLLYKSLIKIRNRLSK